MSSTISSSASHFKFPFPLPCTPTTTDSSSGVLGRLGSSAQSELPLFKHLEPTGELVSVSCSQSTLSLDTCPRLHAYRADKSLARPEDLPQTNFLSSIRHNACSGSRGSVQVLADVHQALSRWKSEHLFYPSYPRRQVLHPLKKSPCRSTSKPSPTSLASSPRLPREYTTLRLISQAPTTLPRLSNMRFLNISEPSAMRDC